jgi:hypothetical protein
MPYIGYSKPTDSTGHVWELVIGSADIDARAAAVAAGAPGGPIKAVRVLSGTGILAYQDEQGGTVQVGNVTALQVGDELDPIVISKILGTSNATPSAALTLRVRS